ncbi:MAG: DNA cytosine methyltransferase, partial [Myxococcales bacterium]|nr:DNA cytosine methyltransferase [Myxococcales bacterium]
MYSVEIFTGAGGLAIATHRAKFKHRLLAEWNHNACNTLRANIQTPAIRGIKSWNVVEGDVRKVDFSTVGETDLVAGGPPCQPFSIGGNHKGNGDDRDMIPQ